MQITLVQSELETAIKDYVHSIMHIKEGMEISIEMRAGRGENGYTANIDIVKQGTKLPPKPLLTITKRSSEEPVNKEEEVVEQEAPPIKPQFNPEIANTTSNVEEAEADVYADAFEAATATTEEAKPRNSIFANLKI